MLREQVLQAWNSYKQKITKLTQDLAFLTEQTYYETALPSFPLGLDTARGNLDHWTNPQFKKGIYENKNQVLKVAQGSLSDVASSYLNSISMFETLTHGWKKERDSYARFRENNESGGPTLEEVDDW